MLARMRRDFDVAIVGAGAAGVGAARRLAGGGLSAIVIEASARVGGRAWTLEAAGLPLDLGCGWLHSANRNSWARIAKESGTPLDRGPSAWSEQYRDLGFSPAEQAAADRTFAVWKSRLESAPPASDRAADAMEPGSEWNPYLEAISAYINGDVLARVSIADYLAYDEAATRHNWRAPAGYGALISSGFPAGVGLRLSAPVNAVERVKAGVALATPQGEVRARCAILTVSTAVLAGGAMRLPPGCDPWLRAAEQLPLGRNEKLFFEITVPDRSEPETHVIGNPRDARTGSYYIRPFGRPVIECFLGADGARIVEAEGPVAGFAHAAEELAALFGSEARRALRPLAASNWARTDRIGGGYSHALPGCAAARAALARPFEGRIFFAGEATHPYDFSTAHGAHDSGVRAAEEAIGALAGRDS